MRIGNNVRKILDDHDIYFTLDKVNRWIVLHLMQYWEQYNHYGTDYGVHKA